MKIKSLLRIFIPILVVTVLVSMVFAASPAPKVVAKHGGGPAANPNPGSPWQFPNPPGWSESIAKHGGGPAANPNPGSPWQFPTPPGWSQA